MQEHIQIYRDLSMSHTRKEGLQTGVWGAQITGQPTTYWGPGHTSTSQESLGYVLGSLMTRVRE